MIKFGVPAMVWTTVKTGRQRLVIDGYYTEGARPNWTRKERYQVWKMHVQQRACCAGIELPLRATKEKPFYVVTMAYFVSGIHPDPENVHKGIVDALCYVSPADRMAGAKKGSDKYIGGIFFAPQYDKENPRVEVRVLGDEEFERACLDHFRGLVERVEYGAWEESK